MMQGVRGPLTHGYKSFDEIYPVAERVCTTAARYLREAMFRLVSLLNFGQEMTINCEIKRLALERAGPLCSGVEAPDVVLCGVLAIFRACEVHAPEYPPGAIFR